MLKSTFALSAAALIIALSTCSTPVSDLPESARLATAVAGTLEVATKTDITPDSLQTYEKLGTEQPSPSVSQRVKTPSGSEGLRIAYTSAGNVWIIVGEDPPRQLSHTQHADRVFLSSDGAVVAYAHNDVDAGVFELRVVNADGSDDRLILDQAAFDALYPLDSARHFLPSQMIFLSGTHRLLFNTQAAFERPGYIKNDDVLSIDVDTESLKRLLAPGSGGNFYPSPDGTKLAIIQADRIGLADSDGSNLLPKLLTFAEVMTYSEFTFYPEPVWSPDSSHFAVVIPSKDPLATNPTSTVWILSEDGSPPTKTAILDGQSFFPQAFGAPVIASDLSKIAFIRSGSEQNEGHLVIADEDGSSEIVYSTGNLRWIGWSPDSSAFAYSVGPKDLKLGAIGELPLPLGDGIQFRWVNSEDYLFLTRNRGDWALMIGCVGAAVEEIVRPVGDIIAYDFMP
jgi:hypothetical protein